MEAVYWGTCDIWGKGEGSGPWVMADLENGEGGTVTAASTASASVTRRHRPFTSSPPPNLL